MRSIPDFGHQTKEQTNHQHQDFCFQLLNKKIKKIAVLGGSGSFAIADAKRAGADVFVTADLKYHNFFEAENQILLADIGHYESEQFTKNLLTAYLSEKFPNFAVLNSEINTNPVVYN